MRITLTSHPCIPDRSSQDYRDALAKAVREDFESLLAPSIHDTTRPGHGRTHRTERKEKKS